jgi:hypothetical protein
MRELVRIRKVEPVRDFIVRLEFTDASSKEIDLAVYMHGPIFAPMRADPAIFRSVRVDAQLGTIVWPNGADIDPDVLYHQTKPAWMEQETMKHA